MKLCDYGCGQDGIFSFKNGKVCCSDHYMKCPAYKESMKGEKNPFYNKKHSKKSKSIVSEKNKGKKAWNKGIPRTEEEKKLISEKTKEAMKRPEVVELIQKHPPALSKHDHPKWNGGYYNKGIPLYNTYSTRISYAEEVRRNENDRNILEVKCAYCGQWFIPTIMQVYERIRSLEGRNYGEQRIYCSDACKFACPIYHQISYPKDYKPATSREVQPELRQMRFQFDNYTCQKCKKHKNELNVPLHCHHIEGIRWEPLESADIDKCLTVCETCHKEIHKKEDCKYIDMRCN
jgi:hypothetical protein